MGFFLTVVVSGPVTAATKQRIVTDAKKLWPAIRLPNRDGFPGHALLALAEQVGGPPTENGILEKSLPDLSNMHPTTGFTFIEVECFGGDCYYGGYMCQAGEVFFRQSGDPHGHKELLKLVGIDLDDDRFAPFTRGYFA